MRSYKYRFVYEWDYYNTYECITCKGRFGILHNDDESPGDPYKFCPHCGVEFTGVFDKKNPRWGMTGNARSQTIFVIEVKYKISKGWHTLVHDGCITEGVSFSKYFMEQFNKYKDASYISDVRLWVDRPDGTKSIVMEHHK